MANNNQQGTKVNIDAETAKGVYSNIAMIAHSRNDFIVDFASMMPGMEAPHVVSRIVLAPEHAKRLLLALQENIGRYEQTFGTIDVHNANGPRIVSPFGGTTGQA